MLGAAQSTARVSVDSSGVQGNSYSYAASISSDGRFLAFQSLASNLVSGDTNDKSDVFVHDRLTGTTARVSVDSAGAQADGDSYTPAISGDGRYVAFYSAATNLVPNRAGPFGGIYVHDRLTGETSCASSTPTSGPANSYCYAPSISPDGRYVTFTSLASNLVAGDANACWDFFVHDRETGDLVIASVSSAGVQGNGSSGFQSRGRLSGNGRFLTFPSAANNLDPADQSIYEDIFVRDLVSGITTLVSLNSSGQQANGPSTQPSISDDGRWVAFESQATNLCAGDVDVLWDVFVHDRVTGITKCASVSSSGALGDNDSHWPAISADGRFVAYWSYARNLVPGDTNGKADVFLYDQLTGQTSRISVDSSGVEGSGPSYNPSITPDGRFVGFESHAGNLAPGDTNLVVDIFVRDRGAEPIVAACSGDGLASVCPCSNSGAAGHGCDNSASTGGACLTAAGTASLWADTLSLTSGGELPSALSIFLQGTDFIVPTSFGDGLRCAGGALKRLYVHNALAGLASAPQGADASISARAAVLGDAIPLGATRHYQVYYRDPDLGFCSSPQGNTWNASNSLSVVWSD